jgi:hypothetical protein
MKTIAADMATTAGQNVSRARRPADENIALDRCYRQIGISAVAAAARYQGAAKNPANAPVPTKWRELFSEAAA